MKTKRVSPVCSSGLEIIGYLAPVCYFWYRVFAICVRSSLLLPYFTVSSSKAMNTPYVIANGDLATDFTTCTST